MPVVNGAVTLTVPEIPIYIDLQPGQTIDVVPQNYGADLAMLPGVTLKTSGDSSTDISKVNNGVLDTWYSSSNSSTEAWQDTTPAGQTPWIEMDFPTSQSINHTVLYSSIPWSVRGTL